MLSTKNLMSHQAFQSFSHKCKSLFFQSFQKEFTRFLFEGKVNVLKGNLQNVKRHHVTKFQNKNQFFSPERITWKQRRDVLSSKEVLQLIKVITPPVINHLSWHGAIFFTFLLLYTTRVSLLESMSFQSIKMNQIPRTELIRSKRR